MSCHVMYRVHEALNATSELIHPYQIYIYFIYLICLFILFILWRTRLRREYESGFVFPQSHPVRLGLFQFPCGQHFCLWSRRTRSKIKDLSTLGWKRLLGLRMQFSFFFEAGTPLVCLHRSLLELLLSKTLRSDVIRPLKRPFLSLIFAFVRTSKSLSIGWKRFWMWKLTCI